jgi:hypothetical protein
VQSCKCCRRRFDGVHRRRRAGSFWLWARATFGVVLGRVRPHHGVPKGGNSTAHRGIGAKRRCAFAQATKSRGTLKSARFLACLLHRHLARAGLAGTGIAFVIYYQLIQSLGALKAASVYYIPPVVALVVGWAIAGETITLVQALGATLVMAGIFYAIRNGSGTSPACAS